MVGRRVSASSSSTRWSRLSASDKLARIAAYHPDQAIFLESLMNDIWKAKASIRPGAPVASAHGLPRASASASVAHRSVHR